MGKFFANFVRGCRRLRIGRISIGVAVVVGEVVECGGEGDDGLLRRAIQ